MEVIIYQELLNEISQAIEIMRPEMLAAHTQRYHKKIPFPYNVNDPTDSIKLDILDSEVDYDVRGSKVSLVIQPKKLEFSLNVDVSTLLTHKAESVEARFQAGFFMTGFFDKAKKKVYPLIVNEANVVNLVPIGLETTISWFLAESISESTQEQGIPLEVELIPKKITLLISPPIFDSGEIHLSAKIK